MFTVICVAINFYLFGLAPSFRKYASFYSFFIFLIAILSPAVFPLRSDGLRYYSTFHTLVTSHPLTYNVLTGNIVSINYYNTAKDGIAFIASIFAFPFQDDSQAAYLTAIFEVCIICVIYIDRSLNSSSLPCMFNTTFLLFNPIILYFNLRGIREAVAIIAIFSIYAWFIRSDSTLSFPLHHQKFIWIKINSYLFFFIFSVIVIICKWQLYPLIIIMTLNHFSRTTAPLIFKILIKLRLSIKALLRALVILLISITCYAFILIPISLNSSPKYLHSFFVDPFQLIYTFLQSDSLSLISEDFRGFQVGGNLMNASVILSLVYAAYSMFIFSQKLYAAYPESIPLSLFYTARYYCLYRILVLSCLLLTPLAFLIIDTNTIGNRFLVAPVSLLIGSWLFPFVPFISFGTIKAIRAKFFLLQFVNPKSLVQP